MNTNKNVYMRYDRKGVSNDDLIKMLISMFKIREIETRIAELVEKKEIITPCHLYIGQEAIAVGVCMALTNKDYVFGTHRSHGHYIAKGGNVARAIAEIYGKSSGCSGGRGGSMHLCDTSVRILGTSSIVAGGVPIGVGAGLAEFLKGTNNISVIFHGDGVPEEGAWNESLNFAAINKLPVLFVCENNLYCTHMPLLERRVKDNLSELANAHGIPSITIDGNNVLSIYNTTNKIVQKIRNNQGPQFIECKTYRWLGHVGPKDNLEVGLRSTQELALWKERCPIKNYENYLLGNHIISEEKKYEYYSAIKREIEDAIQFAQKSSYPTEDTLLRNIYCESI